MTAGMASIPAELFIKGQGEDMTLIREKDGRRLHIKSKLMGESLVSKSFLEGLKMAPQERLFPDVHVLKIGGNRSAIAASRRFRRSSRRLPRTAKTIRCSSPQAAAREAVISMP